MNRLKMGAWHHSAVPLWWGRRVNPDMVEQVWLKTGFVSVVLGVQITILAEKKLS